MVLDSISLTIGTKLQKLNNRAGWVISEFGYETRSSENKGQLGWTKLGERRAEHKCMCYNVHNFTSSSTNIPEAAFSSWQYCL